MRRILLSIVFLLMLCAPALATDVTLSSFQPSFTWRYGSPVTLRVYVSTQFLTSDGVVVQASPVGGPNFYKTITCSVVNGVVTVPSFTLPSTDDARPNSARYTLIFYAGATKRDTLFSNYRWPIAYGATMTVAQLVTWNTTAPAPPRPGFPDTVQVQTLINQVLPVADASDVIKGKVKTSAAPTSATNPIAVGQNVMPFNVKDAAYGAIGDGVADDRTAIQAAFDAVPSGGGSVFFPKGIYLVSGAIRPKSNTSIVGEGYGSQIKCPTGGWTVAFSANAGIINVNSVNKIRISNLRVTGTKLATSVTNTPKLIYFETVNGLMVDHCWFDNTIDEGIWQGGTQTTNVRVFITNNYFTDIGYDATAYKDNCSIQLNVEDAVVSNNVFYQTGTAVAGSGQRLSITGNQIRDISGIGINVGDGEFVGKVIISGNTVEFNESTTGNPRSGIRVGRGNDSGNHLTNVTGNTVRGIGTAARGTLVCYKVAGTASTTLYADVQLVGNTAEIQVRGTGFQIEASGGDGNFTTLSSNTIRLLAENGVSYGILSNTGGAGLINTVRASGNRAYGFTRAQGSYAFYYVELGGGTLNAIIQGDVTEEGGIQLGDVNVNAGGELDSVPWYDTNDLTASSNFLRSPTVAMLNLYSAQSSKEIVSGVITLAGTSASSLNRRTQIILDTETATPTDDLDTINGTQAGDLVILRSFTNGRDPTVKNGTGNIFCGSDFTLATTRDRMFLISDGTNLYQISRSTN